MGDEVDWRLAVTKDWLHPLDVIDLLVLLSCAWQPIQVDVNTEPLHELSAVCLH